MAKRVRADSGCSRDLSASQPQESLRVAKVCLTLEAWIYQSRIPSQCLAFLLSSWSLACRGLLVLVLPDW
jgi:hypothetical protein